MASDYDDHGTVAAELLAALLAADQVESFLGEVAHQALGVVGGALSCGVTVQATARSRFLGATTDAFAERMDAIQYDVEQGPCLTSLTEGAVVIIEDIAADTRWPEFSRRGQAEGATQSLSVPLMVENRAVGAVNLYSRKPDAFTPEDLDRVRRFAGHAAGAVALSIRLAEREDKARNLEIALRSRSTIDRAVGALMATLKIDADEAFDVLRKRSQSNNVPLRDVAPSILDQLSRRTR